MDEIFSNAAAKLTQYPMLGKPGVIPGTREVIPHECYRLVYEIDGETVWILTLVHTARLWPPVGDQASIMATTIAACWRTAFEPDRGSAAPGQQPSAARPG